MATNTIDIVAANIERVMSARAIESRNQLARRARMPQRTINNLFNGGNPNLQTLQSVADALGVPVWLLLMPDVPPDVLANARPLSVLIRGFCAVDEPARSFILQTVDREKAR